MKPEPPPFQIANPCPKSWDAMQGDAKRRFCEHCQHHVHNLSEMSARERAAFVEQTGGNACIAYVVRPDGTMVTTTWRSRLAKPFRRVGYALLAVLATALPFLFGACASRRVMGKPKPDSSHCNIPPGNKLVAGGMTAPKVQPVADDSKPVMGKMLIGEPAPVRKSPAKQPERP